MIDEFSDHDLFFKLGSKERDLGIDLMRKLHNRSKSVIWLNPESRRAWGSGDSEMLRYQSACHFSAECNNLKQLERIVDRLLRSTR